MTSLRQLALLLIMALMFAVMAAMALVVESGRRLRSLVTPGQEHPSDA